MPLDPEKIKTLTGISVDTDEDFQKEFSKKYYTEDQIFKDPVTKKQMFGRAFGSASTAIKQIFEEDGIELTGADLEQPIEAIVKLGRDKFKERFALEKTELEKKAGLTSEEKLKELNDALSKRDQKIKDLEKVAKERALSLEQKESEFKGELKNHKIKSKKKDAVGSITWNPDKDEYARKGFLVEMDEKYVVDLDENDDAFIADRKTGARIKADGSHSTFMSVEEVYKRDAVKAGLMAINKRAGAPALPAKERETTTPTAKPVTSPALGRKIMANTSFKL